MANMRFEDTDSWNAPAVLLALIRAVTGGIEPRGARRSYARSLARMRSPTCGRRGAVIISGARVKEARCQHARFAPMDRFASKCEKQKKTLI